jgi:hypothetical protein
MRSGTFFADILELLTKGTVHYTDLDKKICTSCYSFATTNTFKPQFKCLLDNGFIERSSRGVYQIMPKSKKYLALLTS